MTGTKIPKRQKNMPKTIFSEPRLGAPSETSGPTDRMLPEYDRHPGPKAKSLQTCGRRGPLRETTRAQQLGTANLTRALEKSLLHVKKQLKKSVLGVRKTPQGANENPVKKL